MIEYLAMLLIFAASVLVQVALFIGVRNLTKRGCWLVDVFSPANIEVTREVLKLIFFSSGIAWLLLSVAHVIAVLIYGYFYLEFGPYHIFWEWLLLIQSVFVLLTFLTALVWCGATLCAMCQAAIVHARRNRGI